MPRMENPTTTRWDPTEHLALRQPSALLILNRPITDGELFSRLWKNSTFHICADGGANRLFDFTRDSRSNDDNNDNDNNNTNEYIPDEICGDLDSIREDVRREYSRVGVVITHLDSQYETDFGKCVSRIGQYYDDNYISHSGSSDASSSSPADDKPTTFDILALGGLGGRVDQAFSIIQRLYNPAERPSWAHGRIFLFSEENVSFVLNRGRNLIFVPKDRRAYLGKNVGILPVGCPAVVSTKGLEWDVKDWRTEFGEQVSTSNHLTGEEEDVVVEISTDECVLFTVERTPRGMMVCGCCGV